MRWMLVIKQFHIRIQEMYHVIWKNGLKGFFILYIHWCRTLAAMKPYTYGRLHPSNPGAIGYLGLKRIAKSPWCYWCFLRNRPPIFLDTVEPALNIKLLSLQIESVLGKKLVLKSKLMIQNLLKSLKSLLIIETSWVIIQSFFFMEYIPNIYF
jgi:hypothetical protein